MKLTKTEQAILDHMTRRYGRYSATSSVGRGPEGGKIKGGQREFAACKSLVAKGLAEQVGDVYFHTVIRRGYGEACAEITIRLSDNG